MSVSIEDITLCKCRHVQSNHYDMHDGYGHGCALCECGEFEKQLSLEEIADELNLIRTDVKAIFDDVRQTNIDYLIYDVTHRLEALETKLRSEVDAI